MSANAFTARMGYSQGRLVLPDGSTVFVMGEREPGYFHELVAGDFIQISQSVDLSAVDWIWPQLRFSVPESTGPQWLWRVSIWVSGVMLVSTDGRAGQVRELKDFAANVSKHSGLHEVTLMLSLEEA